MELVDEFDPLLEFYNEVPRAGEIEHDDENAVFEEIGFSQFHVDGG